MEAEIWLSYKTIKEAEAITNAVSPDNLPVPKGLFVKTTRLGEKVFTKIECETRLQTFMATIDEFLSAVSVAEKTLSAVKMH